MQIQYERLTDSQWEVMADFLPVKRKRQTNLRDVVDAIRWIVRTGIQWRNLDDRFPKWTCVTYYFYKWQVDGTLEAMNVGLNILERMALDKNPEPLLLCVDSQSVKSTPFVSQCKGIDGNKRINGRKRQVMVDTLGLVWAVVVHAANESDAKMGCELLKRSTRVLKPIAKILVDGGYQGDFFEVAKELLEAEVEISSKPPSAKGFVPVKWRWVSERTFGWFNFFRRLSKDYEKTVESSAAMILWANCQIIISNW